jgi:hypothetical protein
MSIRRVVTAKNAAGKSVVVSDGVSPRELALKHTPGFVSSSYVDHPKRAIAAFRRQRYNG